MAQKQLQNPLEVGGCVYYAQNREDLILASFFPDVKKGFYIDIGAFDPDTDSVTKLFYLQNWCGINVEPQPDMFARFKKLRPRDRNLNVGIAAKKGTMTLRSYKSQGLSTFSDTIKKGYEATPDADTGEYTEHIVAVLPLREALAPLDVPHIHFMKIDVEGLEYDVLATNDWSRYRPEVLCIEANHVEKDWHPLLKKEAYEPVFNDGLNEYFVDSRTDRKQKFDYVEEVVHKRGGGIRVEHFDLMTAWYYRALDKTHHVEELVAERDKLFGELQQIQHELVRYDSIKGTVARLSSLIKRNATNALHKRSDS